MQVVHDRRVILEIPVQERPHLDLRVVDVAVVVVKDVLPPVGHARAGRLAFALVDAVLVVPVDVAVAAIRVGNRGDRDDDVVADLVDDRRVFRDEPIGELHQHLGRPDLAAVQSARQVVERLRPGDHLGRLRRRDGPRVRQLSKVGPVLLEVSDRFVRSDEHDDQVAAFVALADIHDLDARRRRRQRAVVLEDVRVVGQLLRLADVMAQHVFRRRKTSHFGQMVYERAAELRPSRPFFHQTGEFRIVTNPFPFSRLRQHPGAESDDEHEERCGQP